MNNSTENIKITTLPNGIRVVSETLTYVQSIALGLWVGVGSRDETDRLRGISHFIEHMLFKGTKTRTARELADSIESRGGLINAFTGKETTCYEARILAEDLPLALDILTDMFRNSLFDAEEMEREKRVVIEEIKMYEDMPEDSVHELFEATLFPNHPLGLPIIGTEATVSGTSRDDILAYIETLYRPDRIVIAAAGNLSHEHLVELVNQKLGEMVGTAPTREKIAPVAAAEKILQNKRDVEQVHFCLGTSAYSKYDKERFPLSILNNVLGGNMSSRLFQEIREKRGLAYSIGSFARTYLEGGVFCIYGGTSPETFAQVQELTSIECKKVLESGISDDELTKAKTQVRGSLVLGLEGMSSRMSRYGESLLSMGRIMPIEEVITEYESVTHERIAEVAAKVLDEARWTHTAIGAFGANEEEADEENEDKD